MKSKQLNRNLLDAVVMRDINHVRALLKQGADINVRDEEHAETPIILAAKLAHASMVQLLLDAGAEVDARDDTGRTALFFVPVLSKKFEMLLDVGADIHTRDEEGNTILMRNVSQSVSLTDVEELLRLGVDPNVQNQDGETAVGIAESLGLVKIVERLKVSTAS